MVKMTIQQGIYLLATLSEKESNLLMELSGYKVPLVVNGKDVTDKNHAKMMKETLEEIKVLQSDIVTLKVALSKANAEVSNKGKSINELLEEVKRKRRYLGTLSNLDKSAYTRVETGVGVVQYGTLNADVVKKEVKLLEKEVNKLSQLIDTLNSKNHIELELKNDY